MNNHSSSPIPAQVEEWRDIPGYEGVYQVSSTGIVRSLLGNKQQQLNTPRTLKPYKAGKGKYLAIVLAFKKQRERTYIHTVVARAFLGERPAGHEINHRDGDKYNNHLDNLEYVTRLENVRHAVSLGIHAHGETHGASRITWEIADFIRRMYKPNCKIYGAKAMASTMGLSETTVRDVIEGRTWIRHASEGGQS